MRNKIEVLTLVILSVSILSLLYSFYGDEKDSLNLMTGAAVSSNPVPVGSELTAAFIKVLGSVQNPKTEAMTGYLSLKIQKYIPCSSDPWVDVHVVAIKSITIMPGGSISLEELWQQGGGYVTTDKGTFRVYAEFRYNGHKISDEFEFVVGAESGVISPCVYFDNLTIINQEDESVEGLLSLKIEKMPVSCSIPLEWDLVEAVVEEQSYSIPAKDSASLMEIIDSRGGIQVTEPGTYRVYAEFELDDKVLSDSYNFVIDSPSPNPCPPQNCLDSDNGLDFNIQGGAIGNSTEKIYGGEIFLGIGLQPDTPLPADISAYMSYSIYYDHCVDEKELNEIYCEGLTLEQTRHDCVFGCYDGACEFNIKDKSKYSEREVFIVENNWKDVAVMTPVSKWSEDSGDYEYSVVAYTKGNEAYVVSQLKSINPTGITLIDNIEMDDPFSANAGSTSIVSSTPELDEELLSNFNPEMLQRKNIEDIFSYWSTIKGIVYAEDNEATVQGAADFASSINAPLVIEGTNSDTFNTFMSRYVICFGDSLSEDICDEYK